MQVPGGDEGSAGEALRRALASQTAALSGHGLLTIVELATGGIVIWNIRRDESGTPRAQPEPRLSWSRLSGENGALSRGLLRDAVMAASPTATMVVRTAPGGMDVSRAMALLELILPEPTVLDCFGGLDEVIRDAVAHSPLTQWYELVVVRRSPAGDLMLGGCQLFPIGAKRGDRWPFTVTCESTEGGKVAFAVVATEPVRSFRLVSVGAARLAPGTYSLTAELVRPGLVRFEGLPGPLQPETRGWTELVASVPAWLPARQPAHLICAVEISGPPDVVRQRLDRVVWLIRNAAAGSGSAFRASLVTYGPHAFARGERDPQPEIIVWAATREAALTATRRLSDRDTAVPGYPAAAQLECALRDIGQLLARPAAAADGQPVLVTAGSRPPFPPRVDARSGILPCPRRTSWREALDRLRKIDGIVFGAIRDELPPVRSGEPDEEIWRTLGGSAATALDTADMYDFPERLGLLAAQAQHVPFPILEGERG
jgi:hypothetical protein